jgi:hypothetical protein
MLFAIYNQNNPDKEGVTGRACSTGERPLERPRCKKEDNVKMDLREIRWGEVDWINLA